jgi:hypothetical protein
MSQHTAPTLVRFNISFGSTYERRLLLEKEVFFQDFNFIDQFLFYLVVSSSRVLLDYTLSLGQESQNLDHSILVPGRPAENWYRCRF